ncbi:hypothetical protein MPER_07145 [Moniliophthora perniciosa FA553]|nr:hypothetical protein MPER_07145 [Moniliophthora perniciosa FA553]
MSSNVPDEQRTSPRINTSYMLQYIGKRARLIGELTEVKPRDNYAFLRASDGILVKLTFDGDWELWGKHTRYIEAVGTVVDAQTMHLECFICMGDALGNNISR